jgi:UDP-N-acetylglucosamine--N-acetylmuramyl-(pentapeptide) pyrophosphoryl-undecaprenol N-acetylglucosamine transferase
VPLPIAASDEQSANAAALVEAGGAWMFRQPEFTREALSALLGPLLDAPERLAQAAAASAALGRHDAAARLADLVESRLRYHAGSSIGTRAPEAAHPAAGRDQTPNTEIHA